MSTSGNVPRAVRFRSLRPAPWANGRGRSTEIVSLAQSAAWTGDVVPPWRLSVAELVEVGEFSFLPGLDRQFLPIDTTVEMTIDGRAIVARPRSVQCFAGESVVTVTSLTRIGRAINLMTSRAPSGERILLVPPGAEVPVDGRVVASMALEEEDERVEEFDLVPPGHRLRGAHVVLAVVSV